MSDRTPAEAYYDAVVAERRAKGRETYGRGLTHTDDYDWNQMALEEAMDLSQYLAAENLRQREEIERLRAENQRLTAERDALKIAAGFLPVTFRERIYSGDQKRALEWREQSAFFVKTCQEQRDAAEKRATTAASALAELQRVHESLNANLRKLGNNELADFIALTLRAEKAESALPSLREFFATGCEAFAQGVQDKMNASKLVGDERDRCVTQAATALRLAELIRETDIAVALSPAQAKAEGQ